MTLIKTKVDRRSFLRTSALAGGGIIIGFNWACSPAEAVKSPASAWFDINAYLTIADNGEITIMSPNPEIGQNVKTSMPMIVAEELDVDWKNVIVKQAPLNTEAFSRQVAGGSQSIRQGWKSLRMAGATARRLMIETAAKEWSVDANSLTTSEGYVINGKSKLSYGELASKAVNIEIPEEIELKDPKDFTIIGKSKTNVDINKIITGAPQFGIDFYREGMQYAVVLRPPAFGAKLKSFDDAVTKKINGVKEVIQFGDKVAVLASNTWAAMKGKKALIADWDLTGQLESTEYHDKEIIKLLNTRVEKPSRSDGDAIAAMKAADKIFEKTYEAPFLPHNTMEPMNFFAHVSDGKAELVGPIQTPQGTRGQVARLLNLNPKDISIDLTRMGGGFGRRLYGDFALEAAEISQKSGKPVQVVYSREDDMTAGIYRPASKYKFRAAIKDGQLTGYHLSGAGIGRTNWVRPSWFPAGGIENYLVESSYIESNITTGAWRAPITNFLAVAEQSFFDELAQEMGMDAVQLRLDILERAKNNPVGEIDYDPEKMMGVIKLAAEKGKWTNPESGVSKGFSAYYSHNTYVAEIANVIMNDGNPEVKHVIVAVDCGIVVNPDAAINQIQGGVVDGVGHALFGDFSFVNGRPQAQNFDKYRLIRMKEAPSVEVHFIESMNDPTGLGEPSLPPAGGALANAIAKATGNRLYKIPFVKDQVIFG
jgi:isoquinoline 1-oxidoreductase beta subunit